MSVSCSSSKVELQCKFMIVFTIITLFVSIYKIFGIRNKIISYMNFISNIINLFILYKICTDCKGTYYITYYLFTIYLNFIKIRLTNKRHILIIL